MPVTDQPLRVAVTLEQCWHRVPGGTARAALDLVAALVDLGEVPGSDGARPLELVGVSARHRRSPEPPWTPTISVAELPLPRRLLYETWHVLGRPAVERATGPVEVIHATGLAMPPRTVPIVATLHDVAFRRHPEQFTRNGRHFFEMALKRMQRDAAVVLCSSQATADDALHAGIDPERLRVVPLGVHATLASADAIAEVRVRFGLPERFVLHIGTAEPRKNRATMLRAASELPADVATVFVGPDGWGDEHFDASPYADRVHHLGFVSEADKWALLGAASVFCFPSTWEGFGLPVLEAFAAGTPVVTSQGTSMAEVTGDAALLVDPANAHAVGEAMSAILNDTTLAQRLARAGRDRASHFTWAATAQATALAYVEAAAS